MVRLEQTGRNLYRLAVRSEDEEEKKFFDMLAKRAQNTKKFMPSLAEQ